MTWLHQGGLDNIFFPYKGSEFYDKPVRSCLYAGLLCSFFPLPPAPSFSAFVPLNLKLVGTPCSLPEPE